MMTFVTMTVGGMYGKTYTADDPDLATAAAVEDGYDVLDVYEDGGELILVVAG